MTKRLYLEFDTSFSELAENIVHNFTMSPNATNEDLVQFFSEIDYLMRDLDFTKAVAKHFTTLMRKYEED